MAHIYTGKNTSFQHNGKFLQAGQSHASFALIVSAALEGDYDKAASLLDLKAVVQGAIKGSDMELVGNAVMFKGREVPGILGQRVLELVKAGHTATPLQNFLSNLWENPSYRASRELYDFLEVANLPITEDGYFLAYKNVRKDFTDHHTGKMDNSVGTLVSMPRHGVDEDKDRTCSAGLHFAAYGYANSFGGRNGQMVVVKVNPRDVVAIPSDYNNEKGRACAYTILEALDNGDNKLTGESFVDTGTEEEDTQAISNKLYASLIVGNSYVLSGNLSVFHYCLTDVSDSFTAVYQGKDKWKTSVGYQWCMDPVGYGVIITPVTEEETKDYVPQSDNYDDENLWIERTLFTGKASDFPINRKSVYNVKRTGSDRLRENFHFITYDEKHDNLVFRKHNGVDFDYFTVSNVDEWWISATDIVLGE